MDSGEFFYPHLLHTYHRLHHQICTAFLKVIRGKEVRREVTELYRQSLKKRQTWVTSMPPGSLLESVLGELNSIVWRHSRRYQRRVDRVGIRPFTDLVARELVKERRNLELLRSAADAYANPVAEELERLASDEALFTKRAYKPHLHFIRLSLDGIRKNIASRRTIGFLNLIQSFCGTAGGFRRFFIKDCQISFNALASHLALNTRRSQITDSLERKAVRFMYQPNSFIDNDVPFLNPLVRGLLFGADLLTSVIFYRSYVDKVRLAREYETNVSIIRPLWPLFLAFYPLFLREIRKYERENKARQKGFSRPAGKEPPILELIIDTEFVEQFVGEKHDYETALDRAMLQEKLPMLPESLRIVVEKNLEGKNASEIAREIGLSPQGVQKRLAKAVAALREEIEPTLYLPANARR